MGLFSAPASLLGTAHIPPKLLLRVVVFVDGGLLVFVGVFVFVCVCLVVVVGLWGFFIGSPNMLKCH